jgi:hypothetical protein
VEIRRVIRLRLRRDRGPIQAAADINGVIAANVGERGRTTSVSSRQRIVQRSGPENRADAGEGAEENRLADNGKPEEGGGEPGD